MGGGTRPWSGESKTFKLAVMKKDTQRAAEVGSIQLPRDGQAIPLDLEVELTSGHELVLLPLVPDWNNATNITLADLTVEKIR